MEVELLPLNLQSDVKRPFVIAEPYSAETEQQVMETAQQLKKEGCHGFKAGVQKPRTKSGSFEGKGEEALPRLKRVEDETGMLVSTEVAIPERVELCLEHDLDILRIGAHTAANPFAIQALVDSLQGVDVPVLVKNPVNPGLELWIGALERLNRAGAKCLGAIHRSFSSYEKTVYRNLPMWQIPIELRRHTPELPVICDPNHTGGYRELISPLSQQAVDLGFDGLIVESRCDPDNAWSGAKQQVTLDALNITPNMLVVRDEHTTTEGLCSLRARIGELDDRLMALLSERLRVCRGIGQYRKGHDMTVPQSNRYEEMSGKRGKQGEQCGVSAGSVADIFEKIHQEGVKQQLKVINS